MTPQELKNSILQWAVQGRLVPQDPNDEPVKILLEKIKAEKAELIKQKKIKADKNTSTIFRGEDNLFYETIGKTTTCIQDEIPFDIPDTWEWGRLGEIVYNHGQKTPDAKFSYIDISSIDNVNQRLGDKETIILPDKAPSRARKIVKNDDILYATVRPYLHNMCIINKKFTYEPIASTGFAVFACYNNLYNKFLFYYLLSPIFDNYANHTDNAKGVAYPAINDTKLYNGLIPLPPLAEQKRIVEKIESLMPIIDKYGTAYTALQNLQKAFPDNLKKSLLQWAVQGKLVPQDPTDEPAKILLEKIKIEKAELIKQKKIKASTSSTIFRGDDNLFYETIGKTTTCIQDEIPFDIPDTWEWVRLETICEYIQRGKSPKYSLIKKYPVIAQKCNQWTGFSIEKAQFIEPETIKSYSQERIIQDKDLLWNSTGVGTLGRIAIYYSKLNPYELAVADSHVTVIRPIKKFILSEFCFTYFANPTVQKVIEEQSDGSTKQKELATTTIKSYLIPLPPLAEQKRITEKLQSLLPPLY